MLVFLLTIMNIKTMLNDNIWVILIILGIIFGVYVGSFTSSSTCESDCNTFIRENFIDDSTNEYISLINLTGEGFYHGTNGISTD